MASSTRCLACLALIALVGCSDETNRTTPEAAGSPTVEIAGVTLVRPEPEVRDQCRSLAERVGYPLPCPRLLPQYATPYWGRPTGNDQFFQPGIGRLRRWVWLSVNFVHRPESDDHLVISAAPTRVDARHLIFTPKPYPEVALDAEGSASLRGRPAKWFYVSRGESIYLGHTVLVWSERGRTYGVGFHGKGKESRKLGFAIARSLSLSP
jgi:hypothetical protein